MRYYPAYTGGMSGLRFALILTICASASVPLSAQNQNYIQMETEDSFLLLDEGGLAFKYDKNWSCRHLSWAPSSTPSLYNYPDFIRFRDRQRAQGTWQDWICAEQQGVITFSRDLLQAQRRMNSKTPFGAPHVPETGRYNAEMLEYNRVVLAAAVFAGRTEYQIAFVDQLASLMREELPALVTRDNAKEVLAALAPKAKAKLLARPFERCGKTLDNVYDYVSCRMAARDALLKQAEERFESHQERLNRLRGQTVVTPETLAELGEDAALIDDFIGRAQREGDDAVGTVPAQ
ncbi:MAG: hypothetical protein FD126_1325 [Elusimicrobia bacterium]|nr:MAG: hypothetical protein FD126_1325 [Elusimicrobiota bacterium]